MKKYGAFLLAILCFFVGIEPLNWLFFLSIGLGFYFYFQSTLNSTRRKFLFAFLFGFLTALLIFYWNFFVLREFANLSAPLAGLLVLVGATLAQPQYLLIALYEFLSRKLPKRPLLIQALAYSVIDLFFSPKLFRDVLGHALTESKVLVQLSRVGGDFLLNFYVFILALLVCELLSQVSRRTEITVVPTLRQFFQKHRLPFLILVGLSGLAFFETFLVAKDMRNNNDSLRVAIIQGNIGDADKLSSEMGYFPAIKTVLNRYFSMSETAVESSPPLDLLLWPETAYPFEFRKPQTANEHRSDQMLEALVQKIKVPLLFGAYDRDGSGLAYNSAYLLEPETTTLRTYHKAKLLPFGETIPFFENAQWLRRAFPMVGFFGRGSGPVVWDFFSKKGHSAKLSPVICYEILYADYVQEIKARGAEVIVNLTNDSWFGQTVAPYYHLRLAKLRSIEFRLPQIRVTNTGVSTLVLPDGTLVSPSALFSQETLLYDVPISRLRTPFQDLLPIWIPRLALLFFLLFNGWQYWRRMSPS